MLRCKATVFVCAALAFAACSKEKDKGGGGAAGKKIAGGKSALDMLPAAPVVMGMDFKAMKKSSLFKTFGPMIEKKANSDSEFQKFKADCGFDPFETLAYAWIAVDPDKETADGRPTGGIVVQGLPKDKAWECMKKEGEMTIEGEIATKDDVAMTFAGPDTLVVSLGTGKAGLEKMLKGGGLSTSKAYKDLSGKVNNKDAFWMLMTELPASAKSQMRGIPMDLNIKTMYFTADLSSGLKGKMGMGLDSQDQAEQVKMMANMGMGSVDSQPMIPDPVKAAIKKIKIDNDGATMTVGVDLTDEELMAIIGAAQSMM